MPNFAQTIILLIAGLAFLAIPVIYFDEIDAFSAILLASGTGLLIWTFFRLRALRR